MKYTLLSLLLLGCTEPRRARVLVIGNSITRHAPEPAVGWTGNWGMAATDSLHDFAHQLGWVLVDAVNVANLETNPPSFTWAQVAALQQRPDIVVIELGDNVTSVDSVTPVYRALVDSASVHAPRVLCTTTWWNNASVNAMIRATCPHVVDISGFYPDPANRGVSTNLGVAIHPGDAGMALIARAIAGTQ